MRSIRSILSNLTPDQTFRLIQHEHRITFRFLILLLLIPLYSSFCCANAHPGASNSAASTGMTGLRRVIR